MREVYTQTAPWCEFNSKCELTYKAFIVMSALTVKMALAQLGVVHGN
ncbi:hypothetical protein VIMY103929_20545 [Vibrio mytili]